MDAASRRSLESLWNNRVAEARERYRIAREEYDKTCVDQFHIPSPDGSFAYVRALHAESVAVKEYTRVLRILTELTVHGVVPPEE